MPKKIKKQENSGKTAVFINQEIKNYDFSNYIIY